MADDKVKMPSSGAGITTFYEESRSKIRISPYFVMGLTILIVVITILLNSL